MLVDGLTELGLTENEAKVYLALLEIGSSTTGPLIKKAGLYRVIVYDTLEKLLKKGLVNYSIKRNWKYFEAENPEKIVEMTKEKVAQAKHLSDNLKQVRAKEVLGEGAFVYEGWNGIKSAQENYFDEMKSNRKGEYLMVGASRELHKKLDAFFNDFHERRSKMKIPAKLLFNENNKRFGKLKRKYKPVKVKFMPRRVITPSWMSTYNDMVLIGVAEEMPMAFFIKNKAVADSYRQYFYFMWDQSNP